MPGKRWIMRALRGFARPMAVSWPMLAMASLLMSGCGGTSSSGDTLSVRQVTLPDGSKIAAEVKVTPEEMAQGMMFRESLAADKGMLFIHEQPGLTKYWMHNCKIPLDIIWLDTSRKVVEISADTPPCNSAPEQCPNYGGNVPSQFVLELAAGNAAKHHLEMGQTISF